MHELKRLDISKIWKRLVWSSARLIEKVRKREPLEVEQAPEEPGLYRVTWDRVESWTRLPAFITVMASRKIADPLLNIQQLHPPVLLTIGRTTDIYGRIRQHFGTNKENNRLFTRLNRMLPHLTNQEIRQVAIDSLLVEWVSVPNWRLRCLLERYGSVVCTPLFDIDAEH